MSDFVDEEAELDSSADDSRSGSGSGSASDAGSGGSASSGEVKQKKMKKKKKHEKKRAKIVDSSDEDEEDGEDLDRDLEGLIDDDVIEEDPDSGEEGDGPKEGKRQRSDEEDEDLSDEDYDLLEENLGIKVKRKQKRKRIRVMSDDEESEKGSEAGEGHDREAIAREIFEGEEGEEPASQETPMEDSAKIDLSASEAESDPDDFIVDDDGQPISKTKKKKKHIIHDDAALQEAQDIFGVDFDFNEMDQYDDDEEEMEDEYEDDEQDGDEAESRAQAKKSVKRHGKRTTIFDVFEPSELERSHFTDRDQEIRSADMPERFQLRGIPVCPTEKGELKDESEWIYKNAFAQAPISHQENSDQDISGSMGRTSRKGPGTVSKIQEALKFMRNQQFEVPFIAFYRKEYVDPDLNINDLWRVYQWDEKWMQLKARKQNLVRLHAKMQEFQFDQVDPEKDLESHIRALTDEDIDRARNVQNMDELRDVYQHFMLYYGTDIPKMKANLRAKKRRERAEGGEEEEDEKEADTLKQATRKSGYTMCVEAGLAELARKFGLTPEQFGENLQDNYQRHDVDQDPAEPLELAREYVKKQFSTAEEVLKGAQHMVAMQIAHDPLVRKCVRETYYERAKITLKPTKKGIKEIDESHPCYTFKYLKNKPVRDLHEDQYLRIHQAAQDEFLNFEIHIDEKDNTRLQNYFDEIKQLYIKDEFSKHVQEWNDQRCGAIERALNLILFPQMIRELKTKLLEEAKDCVIKASCRRLQNWIKVAPYQSDLQLDGDDYDDSDGLKVMAIAYSTDRSEAAYCACVDGDGEVSDFVRLTCILNRRGPRGAGVTRQERDKIKELDRLKEFILTKKPHVIAVGAESREALMIFDDLKNAINDLEQEHQIAPIGVEIIETELAKVYANCTKGQQDFREYPVLLREAVSIARRLQDPLVEFAQLCNVDEDIMALKFHTLQDAVSKEELLNALNLEFVNRVNEVGVDVNRCVAHPHTAPLVQFVCGLGPRKGYHLLKTLKQNNSRLENRTQLVTMTHAHMGPKVFINCAGFIKIDTSSLGDSTEAYVEVLDGSRVHPETYEWARKMAVDALEYDDTAEDANPAGALEEILESPERLKDLDLDAFAEELERQGYGNKHITLYDIRAELNHRYKDLRTPYRPPSQEERFNMLTKESPSTFYIGKLILCTVTGIAHKRPQSDLLDNADPVRNDETGLWQCPLCQKNDFPDLSEVWNHFDADACLGKAVGVKTRLDNSVSGFIPLKNLSDKRVNHPEERVRVGMTLHCRISKIDIERFQVELTCKTSDLVDQEHKWRLQPDPYYDKDLEDSQTKKEESKKKNQARQTYTKRVIVHPSFHNIDYKECEKVMADMDQGDVVIRPSSKGNDHLTVSWKVTDGILSHVDVREEGKENAFSLGSQLIIGTEYFEDLDEIVARHIQPMAAFARDVLNYKYYKAAEGGRQEILDKTCMEEKRKAPSKIPYYFSASKQYSGKFVLAYMPRTSTKYEFVTVTPEGFRYRSQIFPSLGALVRWFKDHFRDAIPGSTPTSSVSVRTPVGVSSVPRLDSSLLKSLSQVVSQTPFGEPMNPISTPMMTPLMTPQQPPPSMPTPQYQATPRAIFPNPPPVQTPQPSTSRPLPPQQNMMELAKMAEMWAQKRQRAKRTPRPEASPMVPGTPGGGETPLFDER